VSAAAPPPLPDDLPTDLRAFVECRSDWVELRDGRAAWIPVPPVLKHTIGLFVRPSATIRPAADGTVDLRVRWALVTLELEGSVVGGRLQLVPTSNGSGLLDEVYAGVDSWVQRLNDWLAHNGYRLGPLDSAPGRIALRKQPLTPQ
jgi:hypothetical protein